MFAKQNTCTYLYQFRHSISIAVVDFLKIHFMAGKSKLEKPPICSAVFLVSKYLLTLLFQSEKLKIYH